jgi:Fe-S-cluster-containing dehydrogenase component/CRP-like cAMP-binding protein
MPHHIKKQEEVLDWMCKLDIFSELVALTEDKSYKNELDLDVILYGRGYTGGRVGPYVRLLRYEAGEELIREDEWSMQRHARSAPQDRPTRHGDDPRNGDAGGNDAGGGDDLTDESEREWDGNSFFVLVEGKLEIKLKEGEPFECAEPETTVGAMMLLEGDPADYTVNVPQGASASVLEFKRPAIRLLRKYAKFARAFDKDYRAYGLRCVLRDVTGEKRANAPPAPASRASRPDGEPHVDQKLHREQWQKITSDARFEVYDKNHVLFRSGQPITHVLMVKKGWVEVAQTPAGERASAGNGVGARQDIHYLGAGNCFGLEAITGEGKDAVWGATATLLARTELLTLPVAHLRRDAGLAQAVRRVFSGFSEADEEELLKPEREKILEAQRREITSGLVDGTNLLVMDMDLCVRCGNCSLACHKVHGQSRLMRRGIQIERPRPFDAVRLQHVLAPTVCLHCQDPECLTGCPTGSIARYPEGQIDINPQTCIGCGDCATQCPYNAISLVARKDEPRADGRKPETQEKPEGKPEKLWRRLKERGAHYYRRSSIRPAEVELTQSFASAGSEPLVAVKCNLCHGTSINPGRAGWRDAYSCEENCPTGALVRVNPREYFEEISNVIGTIYVDKTHAIGRNIHKRDTPARLWHAGGILATFAAAAASLWAASRYGLNTPLPGTAWTLRWLTGFAGLGSTGVALAYLLRKQIYRRRAGPLRYWMLAHVYFSVIGAIVFLVHGGRHSGGLLASALMISFDLVILSGLFGLACYKLAPRIMTRIEEQPLLIEDLRERRLELHEELRQFDAGHEKLRPLIDEHVSHRFFTMRYLWRQFLRRESLTDAQANARREFDEKVKESKPGESKPDRATRAQLIKAIEAAVTLRRVEALIYLHRLLKLWVAPHVAFTMLMLVLLAVHLVQVIFFAVH